MADISYIGAAFAIVASTPATYDSAGYAALSWTASIGEVVSWGGTGDSHEDITVTEVTGGRTKHINGAKDGGAIPFTIKYAVADAGQVIMRTNNGTNTAVSVRITDPDGKIEYSTGVLANIKQMNREAGQYKGFSGEFRVNSVTVTV